MSTRTLNPWELSGELFDVQARERRARERIRLARLTLAEAEASLVSVVAERERVESRVLEALGR